MESWLSEAHRDWHTVYGRYEICPLDCGANEGLMAEAEDEFYYVVDVCGFSQWEPGMRIAS